MKKILIKAFKGKDLEENDIEKVIKGIELGTINKAQVAALLGSASTKKGGVSAKEVFYFANCLKKFSKKIKLHHKKGLIDLCGTGGDCLNTFNISSAVSLVAASFDIGVVKHGAKSVSSKCGSADVLAELKINSLIDEKELQKSLDKTNFAFLNAPDFNSIMAKIKSIRNEIGVPTVFNLLGPLLNPVDLDYQLVGVYDKSKCITMIEVLKKTNIKSAMVVHSDDGLDELSTTSANTIYHLKNGVIEKIELPKLSYLGLKPASIEDIQGKDVKTNASIIVDILEGKKGPKRDIVLLNAAAALVCANIAPDFKIGVEKAKQAIDSKSALRVLRRLQGCF